MGRLYNILFNLLTRKDPAMGRRRDRLSKRLAKQKLTRVKNSGRKLRERERKAAKLAARAEAAA